jgi:PAS domain S-box-containing protein
MGAVVENNSGTGDLYKSMQQDRLLEIAIQGAGILLFLVDENGMIKLSTGRQDFLFSGKPGMNPLWNSVYYTFADYPEVIQGIERTLKGNSKRHEISMSDRLLEVRYIPLSNQSGVIEGAVVTFTDITKHRQTEAALKEQESFVQLLQEIAVASNEADDISKVMQYAMERICSFTGWPVGHVMPAESVKDLFSSKGLWHLSDPPRYIAFRELCEGLTWTPKIGLSGKVMKTGEAKWYVAVVNNDMDRHEEDPFGLRTAFAFPILVGKEAVGVLEFFSHQTQEPDRVLVDVMVHIGTQLGRVIERKRSERILLESEAIFRSTFEDAGIGVVLQTLEGVVIESNPAFQAMLGYQGEYIRGRDFRQFTHPDDTDGYEVLYNDLVRGKRTRVQMQKRYINSEKGTVSVSITGSLLRDTTGNPKHVLLIVEDITESRQLQNELDEVRNHLMKYREQERLNLARDLHDGPLQEWYGVIYSIQEMVESTQDKDIVPRLVNLRAVVEKQITELRSLANELRPPTLVPFGLAKAIDSHVEQFQEKHRELKLHVELEEDGKLLPEEIRINLFRIYQELLNNIIRHAGASHVFIRFYIKDDELELQVEDNGIGFEVPERWVETARQGHLGLLGVRERAESIGGKFEIQSNADKGTLARITLPLPRKWAGGTGESIGFASRRTLRNKRS